MCLKLILISKKKLTDQALVQSVQNMKVQIANLEGGMKDIAELFKEV